MARYDPLPYVREARPRNLRMADLYLRQGEQQAEAERRRGEIAAQMWGNVGNAVGQAGASIAMAPQQERERKAKEAEQAQITESRALTLGQQRREVNDRENFDLAMGAGSRQKTLDALKDRPELYEKAQGHFAKIDTSMKQLLGDTAAGIADFGYTPEAAMAAMDDLMEQGFDEKKIEPFRTAIQKDPAHVKTLVDSLLSQSPDPRHQAMAKPALTEVSPGATVIDQKTGKTVFSAPNPAAEAAARNMQADNDRADQAEQRQIAAQQATQRHQEAMERIAIQKANQALGAGELSNRQMSQAIQLTNSLKGHPAYTDMNDISNGWKGVQTGLNQKNGFGDITAINAFQRMVDPGATVREGDVVLLQSASGLLDKILSDYPIAKLQNGSKLPDAVRERMKQTARELYGVRSKNYNDTIGNQYRKLAESAKIPFELVGQEFTADVATTSDAQDGDIEYDMSGKPIKKGGK